MKEIPLTHGKVALVDDDNFERFSCFHWRAWKSPVKYRDVWYAVRTAKIDGRWTTSLMHREVISVPKGTQVDHADGDGLNNQRYNLRRATPSQQRQNTHKCRPSQSRFKGVSRRIRSRGPVFISTIRRNGKTTYLGTFETEAEAAIAYNVAAVKYFKSFARINILT